MQRVVLLARRVSGTVARASGALLRRGALTLRPMTPRQAMDGTEVVMVEPCAVGTDTEGDGEGAGG